MNELLKIAAAVIGSAGAGNALRTVLLPAVRKVRAEAGCEGDVLLDERARRSVA